MKGLKRTREIRQQLDEGDDHRPLLHTDQGTHHHSDDDGDDGEDGAPSKRVK